ncbi:MAG TPA: leucine-rich repeat domain-containing protein [Chitinispirillaceae bacterium]|nr:leucine-rich repeat domain-containing protein [Chitinispirillaceae bacterium]
MLKKLLILVSLCLSVVNAQDSTETAAPVSADNDLAIVTTILSKCGIPVSAQQVTQVENGRVVSLDLSNTDIAKDGIKSIPAEIGQLTALKKLSCSNNIITQIPDEIGNLTQLQQLILQSNRIDVLTTAIGKCESLVDLDLRHNQLDVIPGEIAYCKNLTRLWLWGNKLSMLNSAVTQIGSLRELYLKDNRLTTLPPGIMKMNLTYFDVIGNKICEPDPQLKAWLVKRDKRHRETQRCW